MNLTKPIKILVGIATLIIVAMPFLAPMLMLAAIFVPVAGAITAGNEDAIANFFPMIFGIYFLVFPIFMCIGFLSLALHIFYLIHVIKNERGDDIVRIFTAVGFLLMPYLAYPIYYFLYIWPDQPPQSALKPQYRTEPANIAATTG